MNDLPINLPNWLTCRHYCTTKDLMRLFDVSRATIDRWCRENPAFPGKVKLGIPGSGACSTRFVVAEVAAYVYGLEAHLRTDATRVSPTEVARYTAKGGASSTAA